MSGGPNDALLAGAAATKSGPAIHHDGPTAFAPLLTLDEVASFLRLNPRTIRRLVAAGRLPCARIAGRIRFVPADVDRFVQARRR